MKIWLDFDGIMMISKKQNWIVVPREHEQAMLHSSQIRIRFMFILNKLSDTTLKATKIDP